MIGAKVVTNTRTPGQRCFGYVTMANAKDATECINNLHRNELHGRTISVERAKSDLGPPKSTAATPKPSEGKTNSGTSLPSEKKKESDSSAKKSAVTKDSDRKDPRKTNSSDKSKDKRKDDMKNFSSATSTSKPERKRISPPRRDSKEKPTVIKSSHVERKLDKNRGSRSVSTTKKGRDSLSFKKIHDERERQRLREKERQLREEDRRRREIRRRQREEEQRLVREREKLALERRRIEEQKAELLRIERERQKLERDKIELERLELKRQQRKYD